jgi:hypothetical protein
MPCGHILKDWGATGLIPRSADCWIEICSRTHENSRAIQNYLSRFGSAFAVGSQGRRRGANALRHKRSWTGGSRQRPFGFHAFSGGYQVVTALDGFTSRTSTNSPYVHPVDGRPPHRRPLPVQRSCPSKELGQNPKGATTAPEGRHDGALTHEFVDESGNKSRF